jgi:hypothetical protein
MQWDQHAAAEMKKEILFYLLGCVGEIRRMRTRETIINASIICATGCLITLTELCCAIMKLLNWKNNTNTVETATT